MKKDVNKIVYEGVFLALAKILRYGLKILNAENEKGALCYLCVKKCMNLNVFGLQELFSLHIRFASKLLLRQNNLR